MGKYVDVLKSQAPSVPDRQQEESAEPERPRRQRRAEAADAEAPPTAKLAQQPAASDQHEKQSRVCWRCGAGSTPPNLDTQLEMLRRTHRARGEIFTWPDREWERLRELLRDGDVLVVIKNVFLLTDPNYACVYVDRHGETVKIDRRELMGS